MSVLFNSLHGPIWVDAEVEGPLGTAAARLLLDTGASRTLIRTSILAAVGYQPAQATQQVNIRSVTGTQPVPLVPVLRLRALGQERHTLPVLMHTLPSTTTADGLLGLDFFRVLQLNIDFRQGQITLS